MAVSNGPLAGTEAITNFVLALIGLRGYVRASMRHEREYRFEENPLILWILLSVDAGVLVLLAHALSGI